MTDRIFLNPRWSWYFDKKFSNKTEESSKYPKAIKSQFILGASASWSTSSSTLSTNNAEIVKMSACGIVIG